MFANFQTVQEYGTMNNILYGFHILEPWNEEVNAKTSSIFFFTVIKDATLLKEA